MPKNQRYQLGDLLSKIHLPRATYYDERKRIANYSDKYEQAKKAIKRLAKQGQIRGRFTYGYRRIQIGLTKLGIHLADATVMKLMRQLGVQVSLFNRHRNGKYCSYKGTVGKVAPNKLKQKFTATKPFQVIHTDVTQVRLADHQWAYVSVMIDEASKEVLAFQISHHPDAQLITDTLDELLTNLPDKARPIIHSDQGWHYQLNYYTQRLVDHHFIQSMSRKGNCHDNAPVESFFHIFKTELLQGFPPCKSLAEFKNRCLKYIHRFNFQRISLKTEGMTPVEFRNHVQAN